ncbi:hypothetical protein PGIGA_G00053430 [Pangasianodon gigas]|uniref:Uncharacterized protein n=1 Tax=Pangasianodon gigas TaxID=30993 RepID=A0ACC5X3C2_PANGG|nr:hypothetical protein [Pangasianodon gigas]
MGWFEYFRNCSSPGIFTHNTECSLVFRPVIIDDKGILHLWNLRFTLQGNRT